MERLMVMLGMVLAVLAVAVVPALAQDVPDVPNEPVSEGPGDGLVKEEGPVTPTEVSPPDPPLSDSPPSDVPPSDAPLPGTLLPPGTPPPDTPPPDTPPPDTPPPDTPPPDTPSLDAPSSNASLLDAPTSYISPPDIGEQKTAEADSVDEGINEQKDGSDLDEETDVPEADVPEADSSQAEEVEEQEIEGREIEKAGVEKAGIGKARVGKDEDDEDEDDEDDEDGKAGDPKQETEQDADSGEVDQSVDVINTGDNVNLCLGVLQSANTGNAQNAGGVVQDDSEADEVELDGGSSITITPQLIVDCRQIINQIVTGQQITGDNSASGRDARNWPGLGQLNLGTNKAALKSVGTSNLGLSKAAASGTLPRTGGGALLGLVASVLLISGGIVVRRIFR